MIFNRLIYLIIFSTINLFLYFHYSFLYSKPQRVSYIFVESGIAINSFNPPILHILLKPNITNSNQISIIDNNNHILLLQSSQTSTTILTLSDGFHHLLILMIDQIQNVEFYQQIDISIGTQSLLLTVSDQQNKPVENILVHLELVNYSHISVNYYTNEVG